MEIYILAQVLHRCPDYKNLLHLCKTDLHSPPKFRGSARILAQMSKKTGECGRNFRFWTSVQGSCNLTIFDPRLYMPFMSFIKIALFFLIHNVNSWTKRLQQIKMRTVINYLVFSLTLYMPGQNSTF